MARWRGTTTQRGLGHTHQKARAAAVIALQDGQPCPRCGRPMWRSQARYLDLDHIIPRSMGGTGGPAVLAHRWCNRAAGARITNQKRRTVTARQGTPQSRRW
jgi:5-methylcytosine-specific restriction endonuclease McrA